MIGGEFKLFDLQRMLFGEFPAHFYPELVFRAIFVFALLIFSMRMMGKRMAAQLSRNEMAALVSLAAAIGIPLQSADRGLLPAAVAAFVVIFVQRVIASQAFSNQNLENFAHGNISVLIASGVMENETMLSVRLSRERVFAQLRSEGIKHLGEVERLYLEVNGSFTIIRNASPGPGLSVIPLWDIDFRNRQQVTDQLTCMNCGELTDESKNYTCGHCGHKDFEFAVC